MTMTSLPVQGTPGTPEHKNWSLPALEASLMQHVAAWQAQGGDAQILGTFAPGEIRVRTAKDTLADICVHLQQIFPLFLVTMITLDDRARTGTYLVRFVFRLEASPLFLSVEIPIPDGPEESLTYQSLTACFPAANWYERESQDLFGLIPRGHPDPRRLILHRHWPTNVRVLRRDVALSSPLPFLADDEEFHNRVSGEGVLEIPVGPIHAGIIEPGHFRFSAVGEQIVNLEARLFYTHRGIEKQCEGLPIQRVVYLTERICGACTVSSTMAFCQAVENIALVHQNKASIPVRATYLRVIYAELERLYNHIGDIGNICAGIGFHAGAQDGARLKEELLALNERLLGSRYLFGLILPGGVRRDLNDQALSLLQQELERIQGEFADLLNIITKNEWVMERFHETGVVTHRTAQDLGAVGIAARASGIDYDVRRDAPYAAYRELSFASIPVHQQGDVAARVTLRAEEVSTSFQLLFTAFTRLPQGPLSVALGALPTYESSFGLTESPRGANCHWIMTGPDQTLYRYRIRTASYANWPMVLRAALNNMVPDFPLINKSFELCYSCLDR